MLIVHIAGILRNKKGGTFRPLASAAERLRQPQA